MNEWLIAFLLTETVEVPIYSLALTGKSVVTRLLLAFLPSLFTHPLVWLFVSQSNPRSYWWAVAESEVFAVLVEGIYLRGLRVRAAFLWSLLANASSLGVGMLLYRLWPHC